MLKICIGIALSAPAALFVINLATHLYHAMHVIGSYL